MTSWMRFAHGVLVMVGTLRFAHPHMGIFESRLFDWLE